MKVKYVGPYAEVEIAATGQVCKQGEVIDVPDDVAGRTPSIEEAEDGAEVADYGEGLLAQPSNWEPVGKPPAVKKPEPQAKAEKE